MGNKSVLLVGALLTAMVWAWVSGILFLQLLVLSLAGVICHYLKGLMSQSIGCGIADYILGAFVHTVASLGGCILAVIGIMQSGHAETLDYMIAGSAFASGYLSDSVLNKPPVVVESGGVADG
jgi:hypothetical protein